MQNLTLNKNGTLELPNRVTKITVTNGQIVVTHPSAVGETPKAEVVGAESMVGLLINTKEAEPARQCASD